MWTIKLGRPPRKGAARGAKDIDGLCDYEARTIYIARRADFRATLIHEVLHATYPDLDESAIAAGEESIVAALDRLG